MSSKPYEKCLDWVDELLESSAAYTVDLKNRTALKAFRKLRATAAKQEREQAESAAEIERLTRRVAELEARPLNPPGPPGPPRSACARCGHAYADHYRGSGNCGHSGCPCAYYREPEVA